MTRLAVNGHGCFIPDKTTVPHADRGRAHTVEIQGRGSVSAKSLLSRSAARSRTVNYFRRFAYNIYNIHIYSPRTHVRVSIQNYTRKILYT